MIMIFFLAHSRICVSNLLLPVSANALRSIPAVASQWEILANLELHLIRV